MGAELEIWALDGVRRVELAGGRVTVGKGDGNDIVLDATRRSAACTPRSSGSP